MYLNSQLIAQRCPSYMKMYNLKTPFHYCIMYPFTNVTQSATLVSTNPTTYEFQLVPGTSLTDASDHIYDITFDCHPLLIDRQDNTDIYRVSVSDVECVQLIVDGRVISTLPNYCKDNIYGNRVSPICSTKVDFLSGNPIEASLLDRIAVMRVTFWREPVTPFWITYKTGNSLQKYKSSSVVVKTFNGMYFRYAHGSMFLA